MSRYDREYTFHYTGLKGYRLYLSGGFYANDVMYNPIQNEILVGPTNGLGATGDIMLNELNSYAKKINSSYVFCKIRQIYSRYTLENLASHKAILLFPYAISTYSIADFYISNIPLFVPSIDLLVKWKNLNDRIIQHYYRKYDAFIIKPNERSYHNYDPNSDSDEDMKYWIQFSDYYQWPFITVFNSWDDLIQKLNKINLNELSGKIKEYNKLKQADLLNNWCKILKKVNRSPIPNSYKEALDYFGTSYIQS